MAIVVIIVVQVLQSAVVVPSQLIKAVTRFRKHDE